LNSNFIETIFNNCQNSENNKTNNWLNKKESFFKVLNEFHAKLNNSQKGDFVEGLQRINSFDYFERVIRSVLNFNYLVNVKEEGFKFILLCAAIESLEKFNKNTRGDSKAVFKRFFYFSDESTRKNLIEKFQIVNKKDVLDSKKLDLIIDYIYLKRNRFLHEGVHFSFATEEIIKLDLFEDYLIRFSMKFSDLEDFYMRTLVYIMKKGCCCE